MVRFKSLIIIIVVCFTNCSSPAGEKSVVQMVTELNKKCPQMIDSETRLDKIDVKEPNTLVYKYTLINLPVENVDTALFYKAMWPGLLSFVKVAKEMKGLRDNQGTVEYLYNDRAGKLIYQFKIGPQEYKQN